MPENKKILRGEFAVRCAAQFRLLCKKMADALESGQDMTVTVSDGRPRSLSQNALFHKWVGQISYYLNLKGHSTLECGAQVTPQSVKAKLKARFLPTTEDVSWCYAENKVVTRTVTKKTSKLPVNQMNAFMACVHAWCVDYGIPITIPEDSEFYQMQKEQGLAA